MRTSNRLLGRIALCLSTFGLLAQPAAAQSLRFGTTQPGNVIATGNTLGLSKALGSNGPGTEDAIGTFISLDPGSFDNVPATLGTPWPAGTTSQWQNNGSTSNLVLPPEAEVLYAELVWGGSFAYGGEDVTSSLNTPVTLSSGNNSVMVTPDAATAVTESINGTFVIRYYMRSGNVTPFVKAIGAGQYSVQGVPGTQNELINTTNAAGWTLILAYRYDGEPIRNMSVFVGGRFVDENTTVDYEVGGFCAPPVLPFEGTIAIATIEGDADRSGDYIAMGESPVDPTFVKLSGPNNPENNFFCSQINGTNGQIDTSGSFGMVNHNAQTGTNVSGARQGWDIAHVGLTSQMGHLVANQTSAVLRTETLSDSYMPTLAGIAIEVNAPEFLYDQSTTTVDKTEVMLGESFDVAVKLVNTGTSPANNVRFTLPLATGLTMQSFATNGMTGDINGATVGQAQLQTGVDMGDIAPGGQRTVTLSVEVSAPQPQDIQIKPVWFYDYEMCAGQPIDEQFKATVRGLDYVETPGTGGGGQGGGSTSSGAGGEGTGGEGGAGDGAIAQGGGLFSCAASSESSTEQRNVSLFGLGLLGLALAARRRKQGRSQSQ